MTQYSVPINEFVNGWTPIGDTNAWKCIDEGIFGGTPDDGTTRINATVAIKVWQGFSTPLIDPQVSTGHKLSIRLLVRTPGTPFPVISYSVGTLADGAIASAQAVTVSGYTTNSYTLTAAEADAFTDYPNIALGVAWTAGTANAVNVTALEFECPDPPPGLKGWWHPQWRWA